MKLKGLMYKYIYEVIDNKATKQQFELDFCVKNIQIFGPV